MTTVKDLKAYLETLDENLEVRVMQEYYAGLGMGFGMESIDLEMPDKWGSSSNMMVFDTYILLGGNY